MWTPESLSTEMDGSYADLENFTASLAGVEFQLFLANAELTKMREWHRLNDDPATLGKNEAQRAAAIADKCAKETAEVFLLESQRMGWRQQVDKTRIRIEHLRAQLRILELAASIQRAA